jgi:hypothetical protein
VALTPPLQAHALNLKDVRRLFLAFAELNRGDLGFVNPFPPEHAYHAWVKRRQELIALERKIRRGLESYPAGSEGLQKDLAEYESSPDRNVTFLKESRSQIDWRKLGDSRGLTARLETALGSGKGDFPKLAKEIDERMRGLDRFLKSAPAESEQARLAREERTGWQYSLKLLEAIKEDDRASSAREVRVHLRGYAALLAKRDLPRGFAETVRKSAERFCARVVPRRLDLDDRVLLTDKKVAVARARVRIRWKDPDREKVYLAKSGYDEFTLPQDQVEHFYVGAESYEKPLFPTRKSEAVQLYNTKRAKLRWTVKSLQELEKACQAHEGELRQQAELLRGVVGAAPALFPPGD